MNSTSSIEARIDCERSCITCRSIDGGMSAVIDGSVARIRSTTSTVLASGWRWIANMMARVPSSQAATLSFSTLSRASATSRSRTGEPLAQETINGM